MTVNRDERRSLTLLARAMRAGDPEFAERMRWPEPNAPVKQNQTSRFRRYADALVLRSWCQWVFGALIPLGLALLVAGSIVPAVAAVVAGSVMVVAGCVWGCAWWLARRRL